MRPEAGQLRSETGQPAAHEARLVSNLSIYSEYGIPRKIFGISEINKKIR